MDKLIGSVWVRRIETLNGPCIMIGDKLFGIHETATTVMFYKPEEARQAFERRCAHG